MSDVDYYYADVLEVRHKTEVRDAFLCEAVNDWCAMKIAEAMNLYEREATDIVCRKMDNAQHIGGTSGNATGCHKIHKEKS